MTRPRTSSYFFLFVYLLHTPPTHEYVRVHLEVYVDVSFLFLLCLTGVSRFLRHYCLLYLPNVGVRDGSCYDYGCVCVCLGPGHLLTIHAACGRMG